MAKPIEFNDFYKLLSSVKDGDQKKTKELEWVLAEYEHAKDSESGFDELGQIFCHIGVMELFEYVGSDDIKYISDLDKVIWNYLKIRMGKSLLDFLIVKMNDHSKEHKLPEKISKKWDIDINDIELNVSDLAKYVSIGIIDAIASGST